MNNDEIAAIDTDDRCAAPENDDCKLTGIEIHFSIPTYLSQKQQGQLSELISKVVGDPKNVPKEGVHWLSYVGGDDNTLHLGSSCRSFNSEKERKRELERRRPSEFTCPKCGGHAFGSNNLEDGKLQRYCNGRGQRGRFSQDKFIPNEGPDEPHVRCDFVWHEDDDLKYGLKPPGR